MTGFIAVDELADESGKTGLDWVLARSANTFVFRPNQTCMLNHMDSTIRIARRREEMSAARQEQDIKASYKGFEKMVRRHDPIAKIESAAKIISYKEIGLRRTLKIVENFVLAEQEMRETKSRATEQEVMNGLNTVYCNFMKRAQKQQSQRKVVQYEMNRDTIENMHEIYHDAWRSGSEFEGEEADTRSLVSKMVDARGLELPDVYVSKKEKESKEKGKEKEGKEKEKEKEGASSSRPDPVDFETDELHARLRKLND